MQVNATSNDYYYDDQRNQKPKQELDKNAFMQILVNQLRYQNPLSPQDSDSFINQMVQLTTIEQITNLTTNMERMLKSEEFNRAVNLIDYQATALNANGELVEGIVEKVTVAGGEPMLVIGNREYSLGQLVYISKPPVEEQEPAGTNNSTGTKSEEVADSDNNTQVEEEPTTAE